MARANTKKDITVYLDSGLADTPLRLGDLIAYPSAGGEVFEFSYTEEALAHPLLKAFQLDPDIQLYSGKQYCPSGRANFGMFLDGAPDRWGRMLMDRRLERYQRGGLAPKDAYLVESDYLLGVHDSFRVGALRFKLSEEGPFLDNDDDRAAPPLTRLRELEQASEALEAGTASDTQLDEWLRILIAPGGSLGGARPKASVVDINGQLMIAKFPSNRDTANVAAWEVVVSTLARASGICVPAARIERFSGKYSTFLVNRFDRAVDGTRTHFASAMTLTGHRDGEPGSYLELAAVLMTQGANTLADLTELWTRIVFNMMVSNTDDHLRNHGFLLVPGRGWKLAPAYDMNPAPNSPSLTLNVSEHDNARDIDLALSVAPTFRVGHPEAKAIVAKVKGIVKQWRTIATGVQMPRAEQDRMASAFALSER
jgi:serine/threonine-protein kinase HipA